MRAYPKKLRDHALGAFGEGMTYSAEEMRIAESIDQPYSAVHASFAAGFLSLRKGDLHHAISMAQVA